MIAALFSHAGGIFHQQRSEQLRHHGADDSSHECDRDRPAHQACSVPVEISDGPLDCRGSSLKAVDSGDLRPEQVVRFDALPPAAEQQSEQQTDEHAKAERSRVPVVVLTHPHIIAAAAELQRCDLVARKAAGDRLNDLYCHHLPRGHTGDCAPFPPAERMALEWHAALTRRIRGDAPT